MNELILLAVSENAQQTQMGCAQAAMPLLLMFAVFYFLLIRPQQKRQKAHQEMISRLKKGDTVVTNGGLIGTIYALTDDEVVVELAERAKVRAVRGQVSLYQTADTESEPQKKGK